MASLVENTGLTMADIVYKLGSGAALHTVTEVTLNPIPVAGPVPFIYTAFQSDGTALPSNVISFDPATRGFTVDASDPTLGPSWNFIVRATCDDLSYTQVQYFETNFSLSVWREDG